MRGDLRRAIVAATAAVILAGARHAVSGPPQKLSETGLYVEGATGSIDPWNLPIEPQYPLWSDGVTKTRWIRIPDGATIDVSDPDAWVFPVGTKLWKEFALDGRKIETRLMWRASEDKWEFVTYLWNAEQTEATLAPEDGVANHVPLTPDAAYSIPSHSDCLACHGSGASPVLGFSTLQLSDDRDPLALHARPLAPGDVTLRTLDTYRLLSPRRADWVRKPPRIRTADPIERAALGYLAGNCGHCHNTRGPLGPLGLAVAHATAQPAALATLVDVPGSYMVPSVPEERSRRVASGRTDWSAVAYRMGSRRPSSQMPPLGTVLVDEEALDLLCGWISGMGARTPELRPRPRTANPLHR
jgi:mono/diheme cytochrome c family protein